MQIDVVNAQKEKVASLEIGDAVFGGVVKRELIWQSVVHEQAEARRGTHATKNRAAVSGTGKKPWRQKGTGRARVGEARNPLWRKGGTVFGPQPRDYGFHLPKKMERGALRSALTARFRDGAITVVDELGVSEAKTKQAAAFLKGLGAGGKTLVIDAAPGDDFARAVRNLARVKLVPSSQVTARDVMDAQTIVATRAAVERLAEALGRTGRKEQER
ncbi:MAG: 50S ribosomal protein L4 [Vicinamibacteraceae bacterium]|nr:50S ribosomal protein L4 [Vicinamibacteraceae bacterium]